MCLTMKGVLKYTHKNSATKTWLELSLLIYGEMSCNQIVFEIQLFVKTSLFGLVLLSLYISLYFDKKMALEWE